MYSRELLVDEVKKFPVLYNTKHENHKDVDTRDKCWLEISERLGENSEVLKREWKILRDSFRQVVKKKKTNVRKNAGVMKRWKYETRMAFLLPFMTERTSTYTRPVNNDTLKSEDFEELSEADMGDNQHLKPVESVEMERTEYWENGASSSQVDALELFFSSVCQSTKKLPRKLQNRVKRDVLNALLKAEEEMDNDDQETKLLVFG